MLYSLLRVFLLVTHYFSVFSLQKSWNYREENKTREARSEVNFIAAKVTFLSDIIVTVYFINNLMFKKHHHINILTVRDMKLEKELLL